MTLSDVRNRLRRAGWTYCESEMSALLPKGRPWFAQASRGGRYPQADLQLWGYASREEALDDLVRCVESLAGA